MAVYNEILVGRYNRLLQKLLSMKGPAAMNTLAPEMMAVLALFHGVENRYLEGWDRFATANVVAAGGVGLLSAAQLRNPAGSNVIAVMEGVSVWSAGSGVTFSAPKLIVQPSSADLTTINVLTNSRLDARGRPQAALINSQTGNFGASPAQVAMERFSAVGTNTDYILFEEQEIPLLPGDRLIVLSDTGNQTLNCNFLWRERFLEESERA